LPSGEKRVKFQRVKSRMHFDRRTKGRCGGKKERRKARDWANSCYLPRESDGEKCQVREKGIRGGLPVAGKRGEGSK